LIILEKNKELPSGWAIATLEQVSKLVGGGTPTRTNPKFFQGKNLWLTPTEIPRDTIITISNSKEMITDNAIEKSSAKIVPEGTVLLTSRATIGNIAIAGKELTTNQGFALFICNPLIYNFYLAYWLFYKRNFLFENSKGTTFKEISKSILKNLTIQLPPIGEQKKIVKKIEKLFSDIDNTEKYLKIVMGLMGARIKKNTKLGLLENTPSFDMLKQSILKQAFEGNLVPQDPNDEPASELLKRIKLEN